jgi:hypothetical protein
MGEDATRRYFEEVLEATGVGRRGVDRLEEIRNLPENEFKDFTEDLLSRVQSHYDKDIEQVVRSLLGYEGQPKAFCSEMPILFGGAREPTDIDRLMKKTALYYGKVAFEDPLQFYQVEGDYTTEGLKTDITISLAAFAILLPWAEAGLVETLPFVQSWNQPLAEEIHKLGEEDYRDEEWSKACLKDEDRELEGEDLIRDYEQLARESTPQRRIDEVGGLRNYALELLIIGASAAMSSLFFGSALADSSPVTGLRSEWRLLGLWSSKRAKLLVQKGLLDEEIWERMREEAKAGRVWQGLEVKELGALMKLSPEQIIKVRDNSRYSFKTFREKLGEKVEEIEIAKLGDEKEMAPIVSQVSQYLNKESRSVEKDLKNIRSDFGVGVGLTALSLSLGLLPFDLAKLASALVGTYSLKDVVRDYRGIRRQKERSGYFLVRLGEEAEEQEVRGRRSDI